MTGDRLTLVWNMKILPALAELEIDYRPAEGVQVWDGQTDIATVWSNNGIGESHLGKMFDHTLATFWHSLSELLDNKVFIDFVHEVFGAGGGFFVHRVSVMKVATMCTGFFFTPAGHDAGHDTLLETDVHVLGDIQ